jgi:threonine synthase
MGLIESGSPMVCLATAHPAKFGTAVRSSIGSEPDLPPALAALSEKDSQCEVLAADVETVRSYLADRAL